MKSEKRGSDQQHTFGERVPPQMSPRGSLFCLFNFIPISNLPNAKAQAKKKKFHMTLLLIKLNKFNLSIFCNWQIHTALEKKFFPYKKAAIFFFFSSFLFSFFFFLPSSVEVYIDHM